MLLLHIVSKGAQSGTLLLLSFSLVCSIGARGGEIPSTSKEAAFFPGADGYHRSFQALQYINHLECGRPQVTVPEWHKVPGTTFIVDKFGRGIENSVECKSWFLTHFHADHYGGLNGRFRSGVA